MPVPRPVIQFNELRGRIAAVEGVPEGLTALRLATVIAAARLPWPSARRGRGTFQLRQAPSRPDALDAQFEVGPADGDPALDVALVNLVEILRREGVSRPLALAGEVLRVVEFWPDKRHGKDGEPERRGARDPDSLRRQYRRARKHRAWTPGELDLLSLYFSGKHCVLGPALQPPEI